MKAKISTTINTNVSRMWEELQKTSSLMHVASPILVFRTQDGKSLPEIWEVGRVYKLKLFAFHILPLGKHNIKVKKIEPAEWEICTSEYGSLTKTWNHNIYIIPVSESALRYTDEIDIEAGFLTYFVWLFAHIFYRHRQRKWRILLSN